MRDRKDDIPALAGFFISQLSRKYGLRQIQLSRDILDRLAGHTWEGNVRELRNVIAALLIAKSTTGKLTPSDIEEALSKDADVRGETTVSVSDSAGRSHKHRLEDFEREHIRQALEKSKGVVSGPKGAARMLGLTRSTLQRRMQKLGLSAR